MLGLRWLFCVWFSEINAFHWPPQPGPQLSSHGTDMCSNSSTLANRQNETILHQVCHRAKLTLATGWDAFRLLWNDIFRQGPVCTGSEKVSRIQSNPKSPTQQNSMVKIAHRVFSLLQRTVWPNPKGKSTKNRSSRKSYISSYELGTEIATTVVWEMSLNRFLPVHLMFLGCCSTSPTKTDLLAQPDALGHQFCAHQLYLHHSFT